jgi:hypothetical protein
LGYILRTFAECAQERVNFVLRYWNRCGVGEFSGDIQAILIMSDSFLPGAQGTQDRHLIFQLSLLAVTLIAAGLGLMLLG